MPSPVYPVLHAHPKLPSVFEHVAFAWHVAVSSHSLISGNKLLHHNLFFIKHKHQNEIKIHNQGNATNTFYNIPSLLFQALFMCQRALLNELYHTTLFKIVFRLSGNLWQFNSRNLTSTKLIIILLLYPLLTR